MTVQKVEGYEQPLGRHAIYLDRLEIDEHIIKLAQQKETRCHALSTRDCVCM